MMKIPKVLFAVFVSLLLATDFFLTVPLFRFAAASYSSGASGDSFVESQRALVRASVPSGSRLFFVSSGDRREESAERASLEAVAWEMLPAPVARGALGEGKDADAILAPSFAEDVNASLSRSESGFRRAGEAAGRTLWVREGLPASTSSPVPVGRPLPKLDRDIVADVPFRAEVMGLLPFIGLAGATLAASGFTGMAASVIAFSVLLFVPVLSGWFPTRWFVWRTVVLSGVVAGFFRRKGRGHADPTALALAALLFVAAAYLTLAHSFVAPYGLSITGGKAKLWCLSEGLNATFFRDPAWSIFEPAYPPGCAVLTFGAYAISGVCGDGATQLLAVFCLVLAAWFAIAKTDGLLRKLWLFALFISPVALMSASQFYPEPVLWICLLAGWDKLREGKGRVAGWLLLGATGWFKNEGLVFLLAAWAAWRFVGGRERASVRGLLAGLALPMAWQIGCRCCGAHLNDYAMPWGLSVARGGRALAEILRQSFLRPWPFAFAYPVALGTIAFSKIRHASLPRSLAAACLFALFSLVAFGLIYACGGEADLAWHLRTSLPRLLFTPALVLVWEMARWADNPADVRPCPAR